MDKTQNRAWKVAELIEEKVLSMLNELSSSYVFKQRMKQLKNADWIHSDVVNINMKERQTHIHQDK